MNGIILIDKPAGISSFGVVAKVRRAISLATGKKSKVGHAGTLDPFATGLLILMCGSYTKRADTFLKLDKTYEATMNLGSVSSTADPEGELTLVSNKEPKFSEVEKVLRSFAGEISQTPPIFSAIKVGGVRAYDLARKGKDVKLKPRKVKIYDISDISYEYPKLSFTVSVSSGTYIRSLAVDIGEKLGVGGYLTALRRTSIGDYKITDAHKLSSITEESIDSYVQDIDK